MAGTSVQLKVPCRIFGTKLATALIWALLKLRVPESTAVKIGAIVIVARLEFPWGTEWCSARSWLPKDAV